MWSVFGLLVAVMLAIDLGLNRKSHEIPFREALTWTVIWISLALIFNAGIYLYLGQAKALEFFTGYVIEKSLSVDNLFVFIMIFSYFHVPRLYQPKILKWGIIGALVMRALFIWLGIELLEAFHWMIYVFGAILIVTGIKMAFGGDEKIEPEKNPLVRLVRRFVPITKRTAGRPAVYLQKRRSGGDATLSGAGDGRVERRDICPGFNTGRICRHQRPVYRLYLQRFRHHGAQVALLSSLQCHGDVRLSETGDIVCPGICRGKDAPG